MPQHGGGGERERADGREHAQTLGRPAMHDSEQPQPQDPYSKAEVRMAGLTWGTLHTGALVAWASQGSADSGKNSQNMLGLGTTLEDGYS